jgi:hypothetical protein
VATDDHVKFYATFLKHSVDSTLDSICESIQEIGGRPCDDSSRARLRPILVEAFAEIQREKAIGALDDRTTERILESERTSIQSLNDSRRSVVEASIREAVLEAFVDFSRSLADFSKDILLQRLRQEPGGQK